MLFAGPDDAGEWGRKIVEVYMTWYTFFMTSNVVIMGWFAGKDSRSYNKKPITAIAMLFIFLNLLGAASTWMVSHSADKPAPETFKSLIHWAGYANICGLLGNILIWVYLIRERPENSIRSEADGSSRAS